MMKRSGLLWSLCLLLVLLGADWPHWRGPQYNGISQETGLIDDWDPQGGPDSNVRWKREDLGGRSTPIVLGSRLYTIVGITTWWGDDQSHGDEGVGANDGDIHLFSW